MDVFDGGVDVVCVGSYAEEPATVVFEPSHVVSIAIEKEHSYQGIAFAGHADVDEIVVGKGKVEFVARSQAEVVADFNILYAGRGQCGDDFPQRVGRPFVFCDVSAVSYGAV